VFAVILLFYFDIVFILGGIGIIGFFLFMIYVVFRKEFLSKIHLSEKGIEWKYKEKQLRFIAWEEIKSWKKSTEGSTQNLLLEFEEGKDFIFNCSKKIKRTILELCPIPELKEQLEPIKFVY